MSEEIRTVDPISGAEKGTKLCRPDLLPTDVIMALAEHYGKGSQKYSKELPANFETVEQHYGKELQRCPTDVSIIQINPCTVKDFAEIVMKENCDDVIGPSPSDSVRTAVIGTGNTQNDCEHSKSGAKPTGLPSSGIEPCTANVCYQKWDSHPIMRRVFWNTKEISVPSASAPWSNCAGVVTWIMTMQQDGRVVTYAIAATEVWGCWVTLLNVLNAFCTISATLQPAYSGAGNLVLRKSGDRNWERGYKYSLSYAAAQRHLMQFWNGEDVDDETKSLHVIAAAWHCLAMAAFVMRGIGTDDRPKTMSAKVNLCT